MSSLEEAQAALVREQALSIKRADARQSLLALRDTVGKINNTSTAYTDAYKAISAISKFLSE